MKLEFARQTVTIPLRFPRLCGENMKPAKRPRTQTNYLLALEKISTELDSAALQEALELIKEMAFYEQLDAKPELRDSSLILDAFYDERVDENIGLLLDMDKALAEKELALAESYRDQIIPDNLVEEAYKTVLTLILDYEKGVLSANGTDDLLYWANTCSYLYGNATNMARIAYNKIKRECILFEENCVPGMQRSSKIENPHTGRTLQLVVYPNPNKDVLYIKSNDENIVSAACSIRGLDGRLIYEGTFVFENGISLSNLNMSTGVYMIELHVMEKNETVHQQLVYIKE